MDFVLLWICCVKHDKNYEHTRFTGVPKRDQVYWCSTRWSSLNGLHIFLVTPNYRFSNKFFIGLHVDSIFLMCQKLAKKRPIKYQPSFAQIKDVLLSVNWWNLIKCLFWNEVLLFTKYKQDLFVRNRVTCNINARSLETIALWHVASCKNFLYVPL